MKGKKMSDGRLYSYGMYGSDSWDRTFGKLDWGGSKDYYGNPIKVDTEKFLRGVLTLLADERNHNKYFDCDCDALLYQALCDKDFGRYLSGEAKTGLILSLIARGANVKDNHIFSNAARAVDNDRKGGLWLNDTERGYSSTYNMLVIKCMIAAGADVNDYHKSYTYYEEDMVWCVAVLVR